MKSDGFNQPTFMLTHSDQPSLPVTPAVVAGWIKQHLQRNFSQPTAAELLEMLEEQFEWPVRHVLTESVELLRDDTSLTHFVRDYLRTALSNEEITQALKGDAKKNHEDLATLDQLFRRSASYRDGPAFREMIEFTAKFRDYAPYNNMLVKLQNPSCGYYATEKDWRVRFQRLLKEDARPMLILAPMRPVMLVYDLDSTEGAPLPQKLQDFMETEGVIEPEQFDNLIKNAARDLIRVDVCQLSTTHAGLATTRIRDRSWKLRVKVHEDLPLSAQFSVLCHELAHIYLGHLGSDRDGWWPSRANLSHATVEIEAEAVAYITSLRLGLLPRSAAYLCAFISNGTVPPTVSMELITKTAGKLEEMTKRLLPQRKASKAQQDLLGL
jgi:hypothetical protein